MLQCSRAVVVQPKSCTGIASAGQGVLPVFKAAQWHHQNLMQARREAWQQDGASAWYWCIWAAG